MCYAVCRSQMYEINGTWDINLLFLRKRMEKSEYAVTSNELKNQFDIPIQLFLSCIGYQ